MRHEVFFSPWLVGELDPSGLKGQGNLELRLLDSEHRSAVLHVLAWWIAGTWSDEPVYEVLEELRKCYSD